MQNNKNMPQDFYSKLETILKQDSLFVDQEGDLLKSNVIDAAYKADKKLVELLLSSKDSKAKFFSKVKDVLVFNINDFVAYIQDKKFLADSYTKYRNKIGLNIDGKFLNERKEVALVWPFKDCVLEGGMTKEDEKRKEIFFNEILAQDEIDKLLTPKVLTNWKKYSQKGEEKVKDLKRDDNGIIRENLIIKGNNLLALHSLKQQFQNKIKLIYIDPPYNTGTEDDTFAYNNNFKHSTWLTFMKNRLEVARDLLREDGFIAIAIDHAELYYLGALADEIFDRENRVGLVTILHNPKGRNQSKFFSANSEFMLIYSKQIQYAEFNNVAISEDVKQSFSLEDNEGKYRYEPFMRARTVWSRENRPKNWYPIYVSKNLKDITLEKKSGYQEVFPITNDGKEMAWKNIKDSFLKLNKNNYFIAKKENGKIGIYHKYREQQVLKNVWTDKKYQSEFHGTNLLKEILGKSEFSYPKSLYTVLDTVKIITSDDDIILDFFAGSGTTGHAVLEANKEDGGNRKFILCEQLDYIEKITVERIKKVIQNLAKDKNLFSGKEELDFIYFELMKYNELFVDKIKKAKDTKELLKIWEEMKAKSFLNYNVDIKKFDETIDEFKKLPLAKQQRTLFVLLNKNQLYVNLSEIEDKEFKVSEEDKKMNKGFYD
jgi:adenine-specific DNA-methyltransferase